jgi:uncharacterized peroxidase-related enzyme
MAWIRTISENEATPPLSDLYRRMRDPKTGAVDNILKVHSLLPETLEDHFNVYFTLMHKRGALTRKQREMIAVVVSSINRCRY